jgi:hypothetical protein
MSNSELQIAAACLIANVNHIFWRSCVKLVINTLIMLSILLVIVWFNFGSVQPCEVLRVQVRNMGIKTGGLFGAISGVAPDSLVDNLIVSVIGPLTPKSCLGAILDRRFEKPPTPAPVTPQEAYKQLPIASKSPCLSKVCEKVAEAAAQQAYEKCAATSTANELNHGRLNKCHEVALDAWIATGASSPYAHPCMDEDAVHDFVGRCP